MQASELDISSVARYTALLQPFFNYEQALESTVGLVCYQTRECSIFGRSFSFRNGMYHFHIVSDPS